MSPESPEITELLKAWGSGDARALDQLTPLVYDELRRLARHYMRNERAGNNTLQTTALVNEAYLRLVDAKRVAWQDRIHFFAVSAQMMRRILVDAARARGSAKRGGQVKRVNHSTAFNLDEIPDVSTGRDRELVVIDDALRSEILRRADAATLRRLYERQEGYAAMRDVAKELVAGGMTDVAEVERVIGGSAFC